ncbi:unnamed protein product [Linum trigynum]|uniref:Uncharacterized protein n=1 Tax=Linum trigynum TaxID=586398 RepID=A0AAV2DZQ8_9ROSI
MGTNRTWILRQRNLRTETMHPMATNKNQDSKAEESSQEGMEGDLPTSVEGPNTTKTKGLFEGYEIMKITGTGAKMDGIFIMNNGKPFVGPNESLMNKGLSVVTRLMDSIRKYYYSKLTAVDKHPLFKKLEDKFDTDRTGQDTRTIIEQRMHKRFIDYKHQMHTHYLKDRKTARTNPHVDMNIGLTSAV